MDKLAKVILAFNMLLFMGFGIGGLLFPLLIADALSIGLDNNLARMEFLATYGGLFLGLSIFMLVCFVNDVRTGLYCIATTMGGMLFARLYGALQVEALSIVQSIYIVGELATFGLVVYVIFMTRSKRLLTNSSF